MSTATEQILDRVDREVVNLVVHGVSVKLPFLSRLTLALCRTQLWLVLERTDDPQIRADLMRAIDDLIRQDAIQAALGLSDD
jgi:hypothetical protein